MSGDFRRIGEREVHAGHVWNVVVADFAGPDGEPFRRDIVRSPGAVGIVPLVFDAEGNPSVVLVEQYRPPYEQRILEVPAGMRDVPGEPTEDTARRELIEEAGLDAGRLDLLTEFYPSPGMTDSVCTLYLATACTSVARDLHGPEEEHSRLLHLPLATALAMVDSGAIRDAKTVIGLLLTDRRMRDGDVPVADPVAL
ncbi:MAG: NUDIX hydrolase [Ilumatobacteraceae bacterium]